MPWTTSDITLPAFPSTEMQLMWIIAREIEGSAHTINLADIPAQADWPVSTIFWFTIAHNIVGTSHGINLANIPYKGCWPNEWKILYVTANNIEGLTPTIALSDIPYRDGWPTGWLLEYIIGQEGDTSPLDIADFSENDCWATSVQLIYLIARDGLRAITREDLVLYHQMKNTETIATRIRDYSPEGNTGSLYSGVVLAFDGSNDNATVNHGGSLNAIFNGAHTVTFTVWIDNFSTQRFILHQGEYAVKYNNVTGTPVLEVFAGGVQARYTVGSISGQYVSVMIVVPSTGTPTVYIDNTEVPSEVTGSAMTVNGTTLYIGSHSSSAYFHYGRLSNLRIYSSEFTSDERTDLYEKPETLLPGSMTSSEVKLMLLITERAGLTLYDGSSNQFNATLNGPTWQTSQPDPVLQTALISWNQVQNLLTYSEDFTNGVWVKTNVTISSNVETAPDGQMTMDKLVETGATGLHRVYQGFSSTSGTKYYLTFYVKAAERDRVYMEFSGTASGNAYFDLATGSVISGSAADKTIQSIGGGIYKILISATAGSTGTLYAQAWLVESGTTTSYTGDGSSGLYIWGGDVMTADSMGNYIKTTSTAVTSALLLPEGLTSDKDVLGLNDIVLPRVDGFNLDGNSWIEAADDASLRPVNEITVALWFNPSVSPPTSTKYLIAKDDTTNRSYALEYKYTTALLRFYFFSGAAVKDGYSVTALNAGEWKYLTATYDGANVKIYINGVLNSTTPQTGTIDTSSSPLAINDLNRGNPSDRAKGIIGYPVVYGRALSLSEIQKNYNAHKSIFGL